MTLSREPATTPEAALRRFRDEGDPAAAGDLFDLTAKELFRVALSLAPDAASAEDALQETFIAALEAADRFEDGRPVVPWLLGILRRKVSRLHRTAARRPDPARMLPERTSSDPADEAADREDEARVHAAIEDLDEPYRSVALLRWRYGMEPAEIAHVRGEAPGTVRSLLHRAARKLEPALGALPGGIVAGVGGAGLALVRTRVISAARDLCPGPLTTGASAGAAATGVGAASLLTGGLFMGNAVKFAAVAALVLVAGGVALMSSDRGRDRAPDVGTAEMDASVEADDAVGRRHVGRATEAEPERDAGSESALPPPVDLDACDRDLDVHGVVVTVDGEPVAGASIELTAYPWRRTSFLNMEGYRQSEPVATRLSAENGTFAVRLRRGALVSVEITAEGLSPVSVTDVQAGERLRVEMRPLAEGAVELAIKVVDAGGSVVSAAEIRVFTVRGSVASIDREGVTDNDGVAIFPGLPANVGVQLDVDAAGHGSPSWIPCQIGDAGKQHVDVELPRGRTLRGVITNAATGAPIVGAKIGMNWVQRKAVFSGAEGIYELPGWTGKGASDIAVTAEGFGRQKLEVGESETLDVALHPGDSVNGRLVDGAGVPIGGAIVGAVGSDYSRPGAQTTSFGHTRSDPDGTFLITSLRRDLPHALIVTASGYGRTLYDFDPFPGAPGTIDLGDVRVHAARAIEGVVEDADGRPVPRMQVVLNGANSDRARLRPGQPALTFFYGNSEERRTDDRGRFRFPDLSDGEYVVKARPDGQPARGTLVNLQGADLLGVRVRLTAGHKIRVRVEGPDGEPLVGIYVAPITGGGNARTDDAGVAMLTVERGQLVQILVFTMGEVDPEWVSPGPELVRADQDEVTFTFERGQFLKVRVLDPAGDPAVGVQVEVRRNGQAMRSGTTDDEGRAAIHVPGSATVDLTVRPDKQVNVGRRISFEALEFTGEARGVQPGGEGETVIRCTAVVLDRTLPVRVVGPDGEPAVGVTVFVVHPPMPSVTPQLTDADGRVTLAKLPARKLSIMAMLASSALPEGWMAPSAAIVTPDGEELVLAFRRGTFVTGIVTLPDGKPAKNCMVHARRGEASLGTAQTDVDGRFRLVVADDEEPFTVRASSISSDGKLVQAELSNASPGDDIVLRLKR